MQVTPTTAAPARWDALDVLRGLTIMLMLLNLSPGSWEHNFGFLVHAPWEGWRLIDMVAPAFLFCIGVSMPLSLERRSARGATKGALMRHVLWRGLLLVAIGFFLNLYPRFDFATVRIPGVLQRIGLCYALVGAFMLITSRADAGGIAFRPKPLFVASLVVLVAYFVLLYFVPVPGYGAPRFDQFGSWPTVIDRAVLGVEHLFPYWPVEGQVVFDPEGILSTWPACFNVLFGALVGIAYLRGRFFHPPTAAILIGAGMIGIALLFDGPCPIIKNLWTSTFALFSGGFALIALGALMPVTYWAKDRVLWWPARIFGENPLLAYILVFLLMPVIDANLFGTDSAPVSVRGGSQAWLERWLPPDAASFTFGLCSVALIFAVLVVCHRKRWILKL